MIVFYTSGHGFGHASRDIEVLNELGRRRPDVGVTVRTSVPRWLFDLTLTRPVDWAPRESDPGVVQLDSLRLDEAETVRTAARFYSTLEADIDSESRWLGWAGATLVVGDIPPLAFAAAAKAGLASIALGNFTWDWIYEGYRPWMTAEAGLVERLREAYATADLALRLPMHGGFGMFDRIEDVPFIARRSHRDPAATRRELGLPRTPIALLSFGGYGLRDLDLATVGAITGYTFVVTTDVAANRRGSRPAPADGTPALPANFRYIDEPRLLAAGLRYEDLVAACDIVITKPGYGIIAECLANRTAVLYTSRGHFVEYDVLVREMPRWLRTGYISNADLLAGRWQVALDAVNAAPPPPEEADVTGADVVVERILDWI
jgi:hypothetical protein